MAERLTQSGLKFFKAKVTDLARPNRFEVEIHPPGVVMDYVSEDSLELTHWLAQSASLPERNQGQIMIKYHGMELPVQGTYTKGTLSVTFLNDYQFEGRNIFELWMEAGMQSVSDNNSGEYLVDLVDSTMVIKQLGRAGSQALRSYKFYNVIPISVSAMELSMDSSDEVEKFTVGFSYSHYEDLDLN